MALVAVDEAVGTDEYFDGNNYSMQHRAFSNYNKAMGSIARRTETQPRSLEATVLASILFFIFEHIAWLAKIPCANARPTMHIVCGLRMIENWKESNDTRSSSALTIRQCLSPTLEQLASNLAVFTCAAFCTDSTLALAPLTPVHIVVPAIFAGIVEARECLEELISSILIITDNPSSLASDTRVALEFRLRQWLSACELTAIRDPWKAKSTMWYGYRFLKVHYQTAMVMLNTVTSKDETVYDNHLNEFEDIVTGSVETHQHVKDLRTLLGFHMGMIPPLFFTALHCREPTIRRRALQALHECRSCEGLWNSCSAYKLAESVVMVEERGPGIKLKAQDIGQEARVRIWDAKWYAERQEIIVQYQRWPYDETAEIVRRKIRWIYNRAKHQGETFVSGSCLCP